MKTDEKKHVEVPPEELPPAAAGFRILMEKILGVDVIVKKQVHPENRVAGKGTGSTEPE